MSLGRRDEAGKVLRADGRGPCSHRKVSFRVLVWKAGQSLWLWCAEWWGGSKASKVLMKRSGAEGLGPGASSGE